MNAMPELRTALLDLLYETRNENLQLIIGGGYGIYLKREMVREAGTRLNHDDRTFLAPRT